MTTATVRRQKVEIYVLPALVALCMRTGDDDDDDVQE